MPDVLPQLSSLNLPWPADWTALFGVDRPLIVEIGFGYGHFLEHLARTYPQHNIIGLELSNMCMVRMERAIVRKRLDNVRVIFTQAETALHHLFTPASIEQVHINFPDPWFKKRHAGRRLMQRDTLDTIVSRLQPGGDLYLATDIAAYAEMAHELLADTPALTNRLTPEPWTDALDGRIVTKYERKARAEGRRCYYFAYRRAETPVPDVPVQEELDMPHIVMRSPLSLDEIHARFEPEEHAVDDIRVRFMAAYTDARTLLFETYVHEPTINQHVGVVLVERESANEYTLKLSGMGSPRPTEGMHVAVGLLGDWLTGLHPDAAIITSKVRQR